VELKSNLGSNPLASPALRIWLIAVFIGAIYMLGALARSGVAFAQLAELPKWLVVALKGCFSACLALSVFLARNGRATQYIAVALAVSAVADVLLVTVGLVPSGFAFAIAHCFAIAAYSTTRDSEASLVRVIGAIAIPIIAAVLSCWALAAGGHSIGIGFFPIISGTMASFAVLSRFPVHLNGLGAIIFLASDVLVFADIGVLQRSGELGWLTWACYAGGYALVARGAIKAQFHKDALPS
jgi:YhhN family